MKLIIAVISFLTLAGCLFQSPAEECLNSFKESLKDPESGRVVSFSDSLLVYTATNSYGARTQGKALCIEAEGKWSRDRDAEYLVIQGITIKKINQAADEIAKVIDCRAQGGNTKSCGGDRLPVETPEYAQERFKKEALDESGF
jgi:hypothetical protein